MRGAVERELVGLPWRTERAGAHVVRAVLFMLWCNANSGVMCPISMTYAAVPALRAGAPELAAEWEPRLTLPDYDRGALAGMAMTERQGGSDVRANTTRAHPVGDDVYELEGHKWFCSYPPCDVFLVLAQAPAGLTCFLVKRGPGMEFQRLKDKLGTRSLPSSEVEFRGISGRLVGEEGRGVRAIITMVNHTRLDCLLGSAAAMRRGVLEAIHHARHREAFGDLLADQPAMANVLADLAIDSEAATIAALRVARSYDSVQEGPFRRVATAVMKYWVCKRAPAHAGEALECLGGNGYVEESGMPLLYRDAPLNSIWEGSGNVSALDVLRAVISEPAGLPALLAECELGMGGDARLDRHVRAVREKTASVFDSPEDAQFQARHLVEDLALARRPWDPMLDYTMMNRNVRSFTALMRCSKPVVCKVHGFCVAGGTDLALCADLLLIACDAKIGYPPARVWGSRRPRCGPTGSAPSAPSDCSSRGTAFREPRHSSGGSPSKRRPRISCTSGRRRCLSASPACRSTSPR